MENFFQKVSRAVDLVKQLFNYLCFDEPQIGLCIIGMLELFIVFNVSINCNLNFYF